MALSRIIKERYQISYYAWHHSVTVAVPHPIINLRRSVVSCALYSCFLLFTGQVTRPRGILVSMVVRERMKFLGFLKMLLHLEYYYENLSYLFTVKKTVDSKQRRAIRIILSIFWQPLFCSTDSQSLGVGFLNLYLTYLLVRVPLILWNFQISSTR